MALVKRSKQRCLSKDEPPGHVRAHRVGQGACSRQRSCSGSTVTVVLGLGTLPSAG